MWEEIAGQIRRSGEWAGAGGDLAPYLAAYGFGVQIRIIHPSGVPEMIGPPAPARTISLYRPSNAHWDATTPLPPAPATAWTFTPAPPGGSHNHPPGGSGTGYGTGHTWAWMADTSQAMTAGLEQALVPAGLTPADQAGLAAFQALLDNDNDTGNVADSAAVGVVWERAVGLVRGLGLSVPPVIGEGGRPVGLAERPYGWQVAGVIAYHLYTFPGDVAGAEAIAGRLAAGHPRVPSGPAGAPKKQPPPGWTAPAPPGKVTQDDLQTAAHAAQETGLTSMADFTAALRATGWKFDDATASSVWTRVKNERAQAAAQAGPSSSRSDAPPVPAPPVPAPSGSQAPTVPGLGPVLPWGPSGSLPRSASVAPGDRPASLPSFAEGFGQTGVAADHEVRLIQQGRSALGAVLDSAQAQGTPLMYGGDPLTQETAAQIFDRYPRLSADHPEHIALAFRLTVILIDRDGTTHTYGAGNQRLVVIGRNRDGEYLASAPTHAPIPRYSGGSHGYGGGYGPPPSGSGSSGGYTTRAARADVSDSMITGLRKSITERETRLQQKRQDPARDVTLTRLREQLQTHLPTPTTEPPATEPPTPDQPATQNQKPTPHIDHDRRGIAWASPHRSAYTPNGELIPTGQRACVSITLITARKS